MNNEAEMFVMSCLLGGSAGALRAYRNGENVPLGNVISSGMLSGLVALMCVSYLWDKGLSLSMTICMSIATGITADDIIRITMAATAGFVKRVLGDK